MISVITLTYKRQHLLEEAIESFLQQNQHDCEMIIVNDDNNVKYNYSDPRIKIFNFAEKYTSITSKLKLAFSLASHDYMYRLDDDDLLARDSLKHAKDVIRSKPGYDIYRSKSHYVFENNKFINISSNINTGNIYTKKYISSIKWEDPGMAEDVWLTFKCNGKIHEYPEISMLYRWGMSTYHISGISNYYEHGALVDLPNMYNSIGDVKLNPHFEFNYYEQVSQSNSK